MLLAASALEEVALHPGEPLPTPFTVMLVGGLALYLGSMGAAVARAFGVIAMERLVGMGVIALTALVPRVSGLGLVVAVDLILATLLVVEQRRIEGRATALPG